MSIDTKYQNSLHDSLPKPFKESLDAALLAEFDINNEAATADNHVISLEPIKLLSDTKNTLVTVTIPEHNETIVNGKYIMEGEDDKYYYAYHQRTYKVKILKDEHKAKITSRDEKGRLLPGFSLVKESCIDDTIKVKKRKRKYNSRTAEQWLEKELLPSLIEELEGDDLSPSTRATIKKDLLNYYKSIKSNVTTEKVIRIVNDEFDDADDKKNDNE